ncbi:MAG: NTP transferase domain-containing protein [Bacteroidia bacterium]|nr:NTP transferase domain-containing protein [Bacteroidia bacterium]
MNNFDDISVVLLSGGNSSRMGKHKAFLKYEGQYLIIKLFDIYEKMGIKNRISVMNYKLFNSEYANEIEGILKSNQVVKNNFPEKGRTYSIRLALEKVKTDACFFQNIDNPYVTVELLEKMIDKCTEDNYAVASFNEKGGHPILLGKNVLSHLKSLTSDDWIMKDELRAFDRVKVEVETDKILLNINTEDDWNKLLNRKY